jgi:hypothetical protein
MGGSGLANMRYSEPFPAQVFAEESNFGKCMVFTDVIVDDRGVAADHGIGFAQDIPPEVDFGAKELVEDRLDASRDHVGSEGSPRRG